MPFSVESYFEYLEKELAPTHTPTEWAKKIKAMSDFYIQESGNETPWSDEWAQLAQSIYYSPLNTLRSQRVFEEFKKYNLEFDTLIDFGSGLGTASMHWWPQTKKEIQFVESSNHARDNQRKLYSKLNIPTQNMKFQSELLLVPTKALGFFSYSLNENQDLLKFMRQCDHVVIIEPSTSTAGRNLLKYRQDLIDLGFTILAPCTHQLKCPLLTHSKTDWCHDRQHVSLGKWYEAIEAQLPFKNKTITMSYLIATKTKTAEHNPTIARITGDPQVENGKTKQMFCRGENREFLSWLHRYGDPKTFERGDIIQVPSGEMKSNELRVKS